MDCDGSAVRVVLFLEVGRLVTGPDPSGEFHGVAPVTQHPAVKAVGIADMNSDGANKAVSLRGVRFRILQRDLQIIQQAKQASVSVEQVPEALEVRPENERVSSFLKGEKNSSDLLSLFHTLPEWFEIVKTVIGRIEQVEHREEISFVIQYGGGGKQKQTPRVVADPSASFKSSLGVFFGRVSGSGDMLRLVDYDHPRLGVGKVSVKFV
jgi:hypothetical protein